MAADPPVASDYQTPSGSPRQDTGRFASSPIHKLRQIIVRNHRHSPFITTHTHTTQRDTGHDCGSLRDRAAAKGRWWAVRSESSISEVVEPRWRLGVRGGDGWMGEGEVAKGRGGINHAMAADPPVASDYQTPSGSPRQDTGLAVRGKQPFEKLPIPHSEVLILVV
ncbi:arginine biosynthesis bifunctional protein ArgJ [Striga asiatica]|uniref:Arginine biosynthesis bifunctional protein ArgJ n=1 Tax=Striga asiatica TaxID=4170 RepID=A0A5A7Q3C9_STRAF|nr:arginine biosynthesis bifunctional protein ArgJ [Striga asiatica]